IFIPAAGETNYTDAFASGMINIDQHDHSGGPNKGVPISTSGLADFSVTYNKLAANVADITTGIGPSGSLGANQLALLGILKNLYVLAGLATQGFISMNGSTVAGRTFQDTASIVWTNPNGVSGNPSAEVGQIDVDQGGTGVNTLTPYAVIAGGT